jgi:hypothetical protein
MQPSNSHKLNHSGFDCTKVRILAVSHVLHRPIEAVILTFVPDSRALGNRSEPHPSRCHLPAAITPHFCQKRAGSIAQPITSLSMARWPYNQGRGALTGLPRKLSSENVLSRNFDPFVIVDVMSELDFFWNLLSRCSAVLEVDDSDIKAGDKCLVLSMA